LAERYTHVSKLQPEEVLCDRASSIRAMGAQLLVIAAVFVGLIITGVLRESHPDATGASRGLVSKTNGRDAPLDNGTPLPR
jgi:hypothetical protein